MQIFQGQTFVYLCVGIKVQIFDGGGGQVFSVCVWQGVGVEASKVACVAGPQFYGGPDLQRAGLPAGKPTFHDYTPQS